MARCTCLYESSIKTTTTIKLFFIILILHTDILFLLDQPIPVVSSQDDTRLSCNVFDIALYSFLVNLFSRAHNP